MASRIRDLKNTVTEQNEMIMTLRKDRAETRETFAKLYMVLANYKAVFNTGANQIESAEYPDIRNDDLRTGTISENIAKVGNAFSAVTRALGENRAEITAVYQELDEDVNKALADWQSIRAQDSQDKKAELFRQNIVETARQERPKTPETLVAHTTPDVHPTPLPTPPDATDKKDIRQKPAGKPKNATATLGALLSGAAKDTAASKSEGVKSPRTK